MRSNNRVIVRDGDTWGSVARRAYGDRWGEGMGALMRANAPIPHVRPALYAGQTLRVPPLPPRPRR